MLLENTNQKIQAISDAAATITNPEVVVDWQDLTQPGVTPGGTNSILNGTTVVDIVPAPSSSGTFRTVRYISIFNADTVSHTITVQYDDNGTERILISQSVGVGQTLEYNDGVGWALVLGGNALTSITGTANQVTVSPTTGAAVASLPNAVVTPGSLKTTTTLWQAGRNAYTHFGQLNPSGTTSSTPVMMGLGSSWTLTPSFSGRVRITVTGFLTNSTTGVANVDASYGTGTAPTNGTAATGTACNVGVNQQGSGSESPFTLLCEVTGLTLSTPYWFDLTLLAAGTGTSTVKPVSVVIEEF